MPIRRKVHSIEGSIDRRSPWMKMYFGFEVGLGFWLKSKNTVGLEFGLELYLGRIRI